MFTNYIRDLMAFASENESFRHFIKGYRLMVDAIQYFFNLDDFLGFLIYFIKL